jgi:Fe-S cluster assembly protein SufD
MNADVTPIRTAAETALAASFAAAALPGGQAVAHRRAAAFKQFELTGLPHRRVEEWKYTDLRALMRDAKPLAPPPDAKAREHAKSAGAIASGVHAYRLVFVDGAFVKELSDEIREAGVSVVPLATALGSGEDHGLFADTLAVEDPVFALNAAFMSDGALVRVARNTSVGKPIHLAFMHSGAGATAVFCRSHVVVEEGAHLTLIESHEGPDALDYQVNAALSLVIGDGARLDHVKIGEEGNGALHVATLIAAVGARATFNHLTYTQDGATSRNQAFVRCLGKDAAITIAGANLLRHKEHSDYTLVLDHAVAGCTSREVFKSVLDDESRGVFQGKIVVRPNAQKTDARMLMRALLLAETAEADHKPELEIFADDVQCGHGSTAGAIDENLKFYLLARGIPDEEAEALLVQAFVGEAIETVADHSLRDALMFATARWLGARS